MATMTFDTLRFTKRLEASGVSREQAEAFSEAFKEASDIQLEDLVTKSDLKGLESRMTIKLGGLMVVTVGVLAALDRLL